MDIKKKVTMHDVAKKAGVSYQTVSRVLNNSCNVSNSTKEKIEQAIAELKYVPNLLAQQLAKKEVNTIGLINAAVLSLSTVEVTLSVRKYAEQNNYNLESKLVSDFTSQGIQASIDELRSLLINKIIVNAPVNSQDAIFLTEQNKDIKILFVDVDPYCPVLNVTFNPADGTLFSVSHLKQLGHKKIALLAGPEGVSSADSRLKCWREGIAINNMEEVCLCCGDWTAESGYFSTLKMLRDHKDFTAILVANDQMALGAMSALKQADLSIPDDVSVVGYDDFSDSSYYQPALTSVHLDRELQCKLAVEKLISDEQNISSVLPTSLVIRKSTGYVGAKDANLKHIIEDLKKATLMLESTIDN